MTTLIKFAEELKRKRESLEITINEIYEKTRIDKKYLEAIEQGDFAIMPDVYMRAFIRKYAEAINSNPDEIIKRYDAAAKGKNLDEIEIADEKLPTNTIEYPDFDKNLSYDNSKQNDSSDRKINPLIIAAFGVSILLVGLFYFLVIYPDSNEIIVETNVEEILEKRNLENTANRFELNETAEQNATNSDTTKAENDSLTLKIKVIDSSWFRIKIDKTKDAEFTLSANKTKILRAKSNFDLMVGNSGGIELFLNGNKLEFNGIKGKRQIFSVDLQGISYPDVGLHTEKNTTN